MYSTESLQGGYDMKKKKEDVKKIIGFYFKESYINRADKLAKQAMISRAKLLENICEVGIEELEFLDKFGVLSVARVFEELRQGIKQKGAEVNCDGLSGNVQTS
jgi:thymidine kinase